MEKNFHLELWEELFGRKEILEDFTGQIIVKNEYKTSKRYSWDIDKYDHSDHLFYIANQNFIYKRNNKNEFYYQSQKYFLVNTIDHNFTFASKEQLISLDSESSDLFLTKQIQKATKNNYYLVTLHHKKYVNNIQSIFNDWIYQLLKKFQLENIIFVDKSKDDFMIKIQIKKNQETNAKKYLSMVTLLISQIRLFHKRIYLNKQSKSIWKTNLFLDKNMFFSIYLLKIQNCNDPFYASSKHDNFEYAITFVNSIFIIDSFRSELLLEGIKAEKFKQAEEYDRVIVWKYNFSNLKINSYVKTMKRNF